MSRYLPEIRYTTSYEDDEVSVYMQPLTRKQFIKMVPILKELHEAMKGGADDLEDLNAKDAASGMSVLDLASDVLEESVNRIEGLRDANGQALNKSDMLNSIYFVDLQMGAFRELVSKASLGKLQSVASGLTSSEATQEDLQQVS